MSRRWLGVVAALAVVTGLFFGRRAPVGPSAPSALENSRGSRAIPAVALAEGEAERLIATVTQPASRLALFTYATPPDAGALSAALPAPTQAIHYVRLNQDLVRGKRSPFWQPAGTGRLELPLPDGRTVPVVIETSEMLGADRFTSSGHLDGHPESRAIFAYNAGFLHASIEDATLGRLALRTATEEFSQFYTIDPAQLAPCGGGIHPTADEKAKALAAARVRKSAALTAGGDTGPVAPGVAAAENPQRSEVHVMMAYTPSVLSTLSGAARTAALQSAFDLAIAKTNDAFAASLITARVKLVKIYETAYSSDGPSGTLVSGLQDTALRALYSTDDGRMDDIHAVRDQAGADVVFLALNRRDTASIGVSYVLESPSITNEAVGSNYNALFAFGVVEYGSVTGTNVVPHELGHVFGCVHDRDNSRAIENGVPVGPPIPGAYSYSFGYRFTGADGREYHDIMAYPPGIELSYFSTPKVTAPSPVNRPVGIAGGLPGEADAARTIEQTAFEVASYRLQTQAAVNPGTLVNVSTRAYIGTGEQVLIGGFVISGTTPKKVLVRGAGPALLDYGVTNAISNPMLRLVRSGNEVGIDDDWGAPTIGGTAAEIAAAGDAVGAFRFPAGSSDAALLLSLAPGAYTAIVEGVNGATGTGLVEVYDIDRSANKLINLSTRGFADRNGREMIGGFMVNGATGSTKRVLVRVLGPTLERDFNMTGTLEDPFLEVHDANGALVFANDDWSTGAEGGSSIANDFKPNVTYYSEKQIAATGLAPKNRREPCVMLDLPPGNYTVIAKPFELRDPDPTLDQPGKPGVGIIEVYEISP